ncbi:hypothetical protein ACWPKS_08515 [Coraliomargarita sp. W4R72]
MNIIEAIRDPLVFGRYLDGGLSTWRPWLTALRALYGLPIKSKAGRSLSKKATGRSVPTFPKGGFDTALFLCGRRSGKSRICAFIAAFESVLGGYEQFLAAGEVGVFAIVSPTKDQSRKVKNYLDAMFDQSKQTMLSDEVVRVTKDEIVLRNNITIKIMVGDYRSVRGETLIGIIMDECCFFGLSEESKVRNDTELVNALRPGLATTGGKCLAISSPYAKKGWAYKTHKQNHGNSSGVDLVWQADTRTMNPTISQEFIDKEMAKDRQSALSEYFAQFRDDISDYLPREVIEAVVAKNRPQLMPKFQVDYTSFVDISGGRRDDATLAIGHKENGKAVVDFQKVWKPPFNPQSVIEQMVRELARFGIKRVTGDNYSGEFVASAFQGRGVKYTKCSKSKSDLYLELVPRITSREIELLDDEMLVEQLAGLERKTRSGGRDSVDHTHGGKDDLANAVAGLVDTIFSRRKRAGVIFTGI